MTHRCLAAFGLALLAACTSSPRPAQPPTPRSTASDAAGTADSAVSLEVAGARAAEASARVVVQKADSIRISLQEVTQQAVQVFGAADSAALGDDADGAGEAAEGPSWDLDVESYLSQERVEHFVRLFSGSARQRIAERLEQGTRYEPMIRQRMREGGLPEDMYYLALVESGFNPHAYSRAAAVGMWQFMTSTGRGMGLRIDWWVDERRDPMRSTVAAVRFIRGLRDQFGSLYLAAAAYNGGPGRVARGLKRFEGELEGQEGEDVFFALAEQDYLRKETKDYVPQLIAAALVAKDPARYGLSFNTLPPFEYDSVVVGAESAFPAIARAAGTTVATIQELNPQLLRGMTPPRSDWTVRIPVGSQARFEEEWAKLDRDERTGLRRTVTKKSVSLESLASSHGISVRQLIAFNPGGVKRNKNGRVIVGQSVLVPTPAVAAAALLVPDPEIERYGSSAASSSRRSGSSVVMHVVRRGETLSGIAKRYGTTTKKLQELNRLRRPLIFPGQSLVVRGTAPAASTAKARPSASKSKAAAARSSAGSRKSTASTSASSKAKVSTKASTKATAKKPAAKKPAATTSRSAKAATGGKSSGTSTGSAASKSAKTKSATRTSGAPSGRTAG